MEAGAGTRSKMEFAHEEEAPSALKMATLMGL